MYNIKGKKVFYLFCWSKFLMDMMVKCKDVIKGKNGLNMKC